MLKLSENMLEPNTNNHIILDDVSAGLRDLFLSPEQDSGDIHTGQTVWRPDFAKIAQIYPNMKALSLFNHYRFDEYVILRFLQWIEVTNNTEISTLKFVYFFDGQSSSFHHPLFTPVENLKKNNTELLQRLHDNGFILDGKKLKDHGYKISIQRKTIAIDYDNKV